jgi:hypothetical protein
VPCAVHDGGLLLKRLDRLHEPDHKRTKHIELDIYFVRDEVALGEVWVLHVPSS